MWLWIFDYNISDEGEWCSEINFTIISSRWKQLVFRAYGTLPPKRMFSGEIYSEVVQPFYFN